MITNKEALTMFKYYKEFYKSLPCVNGYKWSFYDNGLHAFTKGSNREGFKTCYLLESDIEDQKNFTLMLDAKDEQLTISKDLNLKLKSDLKKLENHQLIH